MKITTLRQFETLVSEMKRNPAYAKGFKKGIKPLNVDGFWNGVAEKLNPLEPPVRDGDGWHKVWKDLKFKVKKKLVNNKSESKATGGSIYKQIPLEEAVANLLQFEKQISPEGNEVGFADHEEVEALLTEETYNVISERVQNVNIANTPLALT